MANPLYYRSSNPNVSGVIAKTNKLFEWDGSGSIPTEIENGKAFMPPAVVSGETIIWSDSYTLGYTTEANAAPVFFSDGGAGSTKVLEMINHIAGRLNQSLFSDLTSAKTWILSVQGVKFVESNNSGWDNVLTFESYNPGGWNFSNANAMNFSHETYADHAYRSAPWWSYFYVSRITATAAFANLAIGDSIRIEQSSGAYIQGTLTYIENRNIGDTAGNQQPTYYIAVGNPTGYSGNWSATLETIVKFNN